VNDTERDIDLSKPRSRRGVLVIAGGALLVAGLVVVAFRVSRPLGGGPRPVLVGAPAAGMAPRGATPEVESRIFQVTEATGRVEAQRGGKWVLIVAGDVLTQDDLVRTGNGRAILKLGGNTEIELRDRVEIRLDSISRAGASVDLRRGRVVAHVGRAGDNVAITAARTRTANQGVLPARFVVTADERGRVTVATTEGSAQFESAGRVVSVPAGSTSRADPGQAPIDPEKISEDIFLTVAWPTGDRRGERVPLTGRAAPGSLVHVNGTEAALDGNGRFTTSVSLRVGQNPVEVEVEDVSGRVKTERGEIRKVPTKGPDLAPVPTELWKQ
jgi:glucodextranase-like protein